MNDEQNEHFVSAFILFCSNTRKSSFCEIFGSFHFLIVSLRPKLVLYARTNRPSVLLQSSSSHILFNFKN